ncbi:MAG TPA: ATP-binding protein [Anaerolineales bacterium]|nr:ATP-binding protein [Anaerolineales bacterium]
MASDSTLSKLIEVTRALGSATDLDSYLKNLVSSTAELTGGEFASLLEYDETTLDFGFRQVPSAHRNAIGNERIPLNNSVAGWALLHVKSVAIDDVANDLRHYKKVDQLTGLSTRSILATPLLVRGRVIGVLEVVNKPSAFTEADIRIAETMAVLAAAAMDNARMDTSMLSLREEARELEQLKNEFIAITSHELRTPLGLILGHSTFLKELLGSTYQEQVDAIIRNAARLKDIIESLTSVDNYQTGGAMVRSRKVSAVRIIEDVIVSFTEMAVKKHITLKQDTRPGQDMWVDVDGGKIAIVLGNLMKNAITFTNEDGEVIVSGEQQMDYIKISVKDNGIGIPSEDLPRVFDRFYQVESHLTRRHGGMGLGLSVAKVMVEMHGGRIWAESEEGHGSTFSFILPVHGDPTPPPSASPFLD